MAYGTVNADVIQTSTSGGILGAGNASIMKNRIINGSMVIDQRNAGASVTNTSANVYVTDRWLIQGSVASKYTGQQNAGSVTPPAGFINYLGCTSSSAYTVGAAELFTVQQRIEGLNCTDLGWGTANAKTVTLSAWVRSSLTGTFGGTLNNSAFDRSYPFTYSIPVANTWTQINITIAGDTSGTWLTTNGVGITVLFSLGTGTTYSTTAGAWAAGFYTSATGAVSVVGTNAATWYVTGVQLEVGSSATGFEYVNYQTSLANCQRYYETSFPIGSAVPTGTKVGTINTTGITASSNRPFWFVPFQTSKRANPTVVVYNGVNTTAGQVGGPSNSAYNATTQNQASNGFQVYQSQTTATADGDYYVHFSASAEL